MLVPETIQPLARFFASVSSTTNTAIVSIDNSLMTRIVAHTGAVTGTGSATLRVFVNTTNSASGAVEVTDKIVATLASNSSYEIFVSGAEVYTALARATHLFVQVEVTGVATVPIAVEISALPARYVPAELPANWTRIV